MLRLDINLVLTIINLLVWTMLVKHFFLRPVNAVIEKRQQLADQEIARAKALSSEAEAKQLEYRQLAAQIEKEKEVQKKQAAVQAAAVKEQLLKQAEQEAAQLLSQAAEQAQAERAKARQQADEQLVKLIMAAVGKVAGEQYPPEAEDSIYNQFIERAGVTSDTGSS